VFRRLQDYRNDWVWDQRSTRLVVWLVLATTIPASVGFVIAAVDEDLPIGAAVWAVTLLVDVMIMLNIRKRLPKREP
jgi:hypothetical protein